jgi:hypothetical protein
MLGAFGVDVNPLVIERRVGEQIDARLIDLQPRASSERFTHRGDQRFGMGEYASGLARVATVAHAANSTGAADVVGFSPHFSHEAIHHAC